MMRHGLEAARQLRLADTPAAFMGGHQRDDIFTQKFSLTAGKYGRLVELPTSSRRPREGTG